IGFRLLPNHKVAETSADDPGLAAASVPQWKKNASLIVLVLTILAMVFEKQIGIRLHISGAIGAIALIVLGVISEEQAYRSIDAKTIFLFGGVLSLAAAMQKTGAGQVIAETVLSFTGPETPMFVFLLVIFLLAVVMTNFMSNTATTALLVPISLSISAQIGADPRAVLMATVIGGSLAYATPIGMPANVMVLGPGRYTFNDYARAGLPLILVSTVVAMILLPILFPFFP
ncbi:MAG TPA: SLC13 family permease, partial [Paracoccus sp. (in: a-proteobacteria)]|nr:SLC13 family permease [Paracoccus sp. (in: a-proteobacteria)]